MTMTDGQTWWCRDKRDAAFRREIDKVSSLQFRFVALGCKHYADGVGGPAEAHAACAALRVRVRGNTMDVWDVAAMGHTELYQSVRNLARCEIGVSEGERHLHETGS